jgi:hypothetical protein
MFAAVSALSNSCRRVIAAMISRTLRRERAYTVGVKLAALAMFAVAAWAADPYAESARAKIDMIRDDQAPAGIVIPISAQELNAWIRAEIAEEPGLGLRDPKLTLGSGSVMFEAVADLGKLAAHAKMNSILVKAFEGDRQLKIKMRPENANGKITVRLDLVEISGVPLSGVVLNLVANLVLASLFDDIQVNEPVEMGHRIDHAGIDASGVRVFIANEPPPPPRHP